MARSPKRAVMEGNPRLISMLLGDKQEQRRSGKSSDENAPAQFGGSTQ
jgi:hypothetical protein